MFCLAFCCFAYLYFFFSNLTGLCREYRHQQLEIQFSGKQANRKIHSLPSGFIPKPSMYESWTVHHNVSHFPVTCLSNLSQYGMTEHGSCFSSFGDLRRNCMTSVLCLRISPNMAPRKISPMIAYTLFQNGAHSEKRWGEQLDNEATRANSVSSDVYCTAGWLSCLKTAVFLYIGKSLTSRMIVTLLYYDAWPLMPRPHVTLPSTFPSGRHFGIGCILLPIHLMYCLYFVPRVSCSRNI